MNGNLKKAKRASVGPAQVSLMLVFAGLLGAGILSGCVRGQDASEVADLLLVETLGTPALLDSPGTDEGTPPGTTVTPGTYSVTDNGDGTVTAEAHNIIWARCRQVDTTGANTFNTGAGDCSNGTATTMQYCDMNDNSCNGGTDSGRLNGSGNSQAYNSCENLVLAGRTDWRVPTRDEFLFFYFQAHTPNPGLFDMVHTPSNYWVSNSITTTQAYSIQTLSGIYSGGISKANTYFVRCVAPLL